MNPLILFCGVGASIMKKAWFVWFRLRQQDVLGGASTNARTYCTSTRRFFRNQPWCRITTARSLIINKLLFDYQMGCLRTVFKTLRNMSDWSSVSPRVVCQWEFYWRSWYHISNYWFSTFILICHARISVSWRLQQLNLVQSQLINQYNLQSMP